MKVCKARQSTGSLIGKPDLIAIVKILEGAVSISGRLAFNNSNVLTFCIFLCFDNTYRFSSHKQSVINRPGACRELTDGNTKRCREIDPVHILNDPARIIQPAVNCLPRNLLRCLRHAHHPRSLRVLLTHLQFFEEFLALPRGYSSTTSRLSLQQPSWYIQYSHRNPLTSDKQIHQFLHLNTVRSSSGVP